MEPLYTMGDPLNLRFERYPMSNNGSNAFVLANVYSLYFATFLQGYNKGLCIYCCKAKKLQTHGTRISKENLIFCCGIGTAFIPLQLI